MSIKDFASYKRLATRSEIAQQLALEAIEEHKAARTGREEEPWDAADTARMERVATLMIGPHAAAVIPIVLREYPQMAALLERKVGTVTGIPEGGPCVFGSISGFDGKEYKYTFDALPKDDPTPKDQRQPYHPLHAMVSFKASDDGWARDLLVLDAAPQAVGTA